MIYVVFTYGWVGLGLRAQSSSSEPHRLGAAQHRLRTPSQSREQTAPSHTKGQRHQGHQPLREEHVGKAVPGLAHRVGAEWRGAQNECIRTGRAR